MIQLINKVPWSTLGEQLVHNIYVTTNTVYVQTDTLMLTFDSSGKSIDRPFKYTNGLMIYKVNKEASKVLDDRVSLKKNMRVYN